jgi:3-oxoadipate enol-lactonase
MAAPTIRLTRPDGPSDAPLLVLAHSLGTSVVLWQDALELLRTTFRVTTFELPGHGAAPAATAPFTVADLTDALLEQVDGLGATRFLFAGVSVGGAVGLDLALRHPDRVGAVVVIAAGAKVDSPPFWTARAASVREHGTASLVEASAARWFAPRTRSMLADKAALMLDALRATDDESYALAAEALADFDVADRLGEISVPVLAVSGEHDQAVPLGRSQDVADGVQRGRLARIEDAAHAAPIEQPAAVARAMRHFLAP